MPPLDSSDPYDALPDVSGGGASAAADPYDALPTTRQPFDRWYSERAAKTGNDPNPDHPLHKYDYRAAYRAGAEPEIDPGDGRYHWPSEFKADDHPNRYVGGVDTKTGRPIPVPPSTMEGFGEAVPVAPPASERRPVSDLTPDQHGAQTPEQLWADRPLSERFLNPLRAGVKSFERGPRVAESNVAGNFLETQRRIMEPREGEAPVLGAAARVMRAQPQADRDAATATARAGLADSLGETSRLNREIAAIPQNPAAERMMRAKSWGEAFDSFWADPIGVIGSVGLQSLPQTAPGLIAGIVGGPAIGAMAMGATSFGNEYLSGILEELGERGIDVTNRDALIAAFSNPALMDEIKRKSAIKAGVVGAFDTASGGLAGRTMAPRALGPAVREVVNIPSQLGVQAGLGAAGEAGGQIATEGRIDKPGQVLAEAAGEMIGAPAEVASIRFHDIARAAQPAPVAQPETQQRVEPPPLRTDLTEPDPYADLPDAPPEATPGEIAAVLDDPRPVAEVLAERDDARAAEQRVVDVAAAEQGDPDAAARVIAADEENAAARAAAGEGTIVRPMAADTAQAIDAAAAHADPSPSPAQREAGNAKLGHVRWEGLEIAIETARGEERTAKDGSWTSPPMPAHYGYLKQGKDTGDGKVDVFVGDNPAAPTVFVIDQINPETGKFDEPKVVIGAESETEARAIYEASYGDEAAAARIGAVSTMTPAQLKGWLANGDPKRPLKYMPPAPAPAAPDLTVTGAKAATNNREARRAAREAAAVADGTYVPSDEDAKLGWTSTIRPPTAAERTHLRRRAAGKASRAAVVAKDGLLGAMAESGGLRDDGGELTSMDLDKWHTEGGARFRRRLVYRRGERGYDQAKSLDYWGEALGESGYGELVGRPHRDDANSAETPRLLPDEVLDLIRRAHFGEDVRPAHEIADDPRTAKAAEIDDLDDAMRSLEAELNGRDFDTSGLLPDDFEAAARLYLKTPGMTAVQAVEQAVGRALVRDRDGGENQADDAAGTNQAGPERAQGREPRDDSAGEAGPDAEPDQDSPDAQRRRGGTDDSDIPFSRVGGPPRPRASQLASQRLAPFGLNIGDEVTIAGTKTRGFIDVGPDGNIYVRSGSERTFVPVSQLGTLEATERALLPETTPKPNEKVAAAAPQQGVAGVGLFGGKPQESAGAKARDEAEEKAKQGGLSFSRVGGADGLVHRLRTSQLPSVAPEDLREVEDFIDFIGAEMLKGIGLRIEKNGEALGQYEYASRIVTIFRAAIEQGQLSRVTVHELWHALVESLPAADRAAVNAEYQRQFRKWLVKNPWARAFVGEDGVSLENSIGEEAAERWLRQYPEGHPARAHIRVDREDGRPVVHIRWDHAFYRYKNADEFWAETMADKFFNALDLRDEKVRSIVGHAREVFQRIVAALKRLFGRDATGRIFDGFQRGEYAAPVSGRGPLVEDEASPMAARKWAWPDRAGAPTAQPTLASAQAKVDQAIDGSADQRFAIKIPGAGWIDLLWGQHDAAKGTGYGLTHAIAERMNADKQKMTEPQARAWLKQNISTILARGEAQQPYLEDHGRALRRNFVLPGVGTVVVQLADQAGERGYAPYVLTAFTGESGAAREHISGDAAERFAMKAARMEASPGRSHPGPARATGPSTTASQYHGESGAPGDAQNVGATVQKGKVSEALVGGPSRQQARQAIARANATLRTALNPASPQVPHVEDLRRVTGFVSTPHNIASFEPDFAEVWNGGVRQFQLRDAYLDEFVKAKADYDALSDADRKQVDKALEMGRLQTEVYAPNAAGGIVAVNRIGGRRQNPKRGAALTTANETVTLTPAQAKGYLAVRAQMKLSLERFKDQVLREFGFDPANAATPRTSAAADAIRQQLIAGQNVAGLPAGVDETRMQQLSNKLLEIDTANRQGYVPFMRFGEYYVAVRELGRQGKPGRVIYREHFDSPMAERGWLHGRAARRLLMRKIEARRRELQAAFPHLTFVVDPAAKVDPRVASDMPSLMDIDMMLSTSALPPVVAQQVHDAIQKAIAKQGFRSHFIASANVPGYSTDFERVMAHYAASLAGYLARRQMTPQIENAIANIQKGKEDLRTYAKNWHRYINDPAEEFAFMRQIGFLYYLGGRISTAAINALQVPSVTFPYLSIASNPARAAAEIARAYKDVTALVRTGFKVSGLPADVRADVERALKEGILLPVETLQEMAKAHGRTPAGRKVAKAGRATMDVLAFPFQTAERVNRLVTFIAAHRIARRPGAIASAGQAFAGDALWASQPDVRTPYGFARRAVEQTQYMMGKINRPRMMRGAGAWLLQFKSYAVNTMELLWRMGAFKLAPGVGSGPWRGYRPAMGLAAFAAMMLLTSGFWGLPGAEDLKDIIEGLYRRITGTDLDLDREIRKLLGGGAPARMAMRGPLREAGFDVSRRTGLGDVVPNTAPGEDLVRQLAPLGGIPWDLMVMRPYDAFAALGRGDPTSAAIRLLPEAAADPVRAWQWANRGVIARSSGRKVIDKDFELPDGSTPSSPGNLAARALGFQPTGVSREMEKYGSNARLTKSARDRIADFNTDLARALIVQQTAQESKDQPSVASAKRSVDQIVEQITKFNTGRPAHEQYHFRAPNGAVSPGLKAAVERERSGATATQLKHLPRRARGEALEARDLY